MQIEIQKSYFDVKIMNTCFHFLLDFTVFANCVVLLKCCTIIVVHINRQTLQAVELLLRQWQRIILSIASLH